MQPPHHMEGTHARLHGWLDGVLVAGGLHLRGRLRQRGARGLAVFSFSPSKNINVGDSGVLTLGSTPSDGSLTYRWNFDTEGPSILCNPAYSHLDLDEAKTYKVSLEVSDGSATSEQVRDVVVAPESAEAPTAEITQYADDEDCEDEEITETRHISYGFVPVTKAPPTRPSPKRPPSN